jgi:hypothetical protein
VGLIFKISKSAVLVNLRGSVIFLYHIERVWSITMQSHYLSHSDNDPILISERGAIVIPKDWRYRVSFDVA